MEYKLLLIKLLLLEILEIKILHGESREICSRFLMPKFQANSISIPPCPMIGQNQLSKCGDESVQVGDKIIYVKYIYTTKVVESKFVFSNNWVLKSQQHSYSY